MLSWLTRETEPRFVVSGNHLSDNPVFPSVDTFGPLSVIRHAGIATFSTRSL